MEGKRRGDSFIETNPRRKNVEGQEKRHRGRIAVPWKIETRGRKRETEGKWRGAVNNRRGEFQGGEDAGPPLIRRGLGEFKTHAWLLSSGFCRRVYASLASARTTKTTDEEQD